MTRKCGLNILTLPVASGFRVNPVSSSLPPNLETSQSIHSNSHLQHSDAIVLPSFLYQFQKLRDNDDESEFSLTSYLSFGMADPTITLPHMYVHPHPLDNLVIANELESLDLILIRF
jgi:hypothetical protein